MNASIWLNLGIAGAVVFVVRLFLQHLRQERKDRTAEREDFVEIISNHMEQERKAMEGLTIAVEKLVNRTDGRRNGGREMSSISNRRMPD